VAADHEISGRAAVAGAGEPQTFRSVTGVIIWWVWLVFAVGNLVDLAVQGRDHLSVVAAATLLLLTGVAYVTALRPRLIAADEGITVLNPLRDHRIPWRVVSNVDLGDLLRVRCRSGKKEKVIGAWAVHYSRRRQMTSDLRARRAATRDVRGGSRGASTTFGVAGPAEHTPEAEAVRIARLFNERAAAAAGSATESVTAAGAAELGSERGEHPAERLVSTWSWPAVAALAMPALILLIVALA
jgi:hypothetical protein